MTDEVLVIKQVDAGTFVNGNIIAIRRFHPKQDFFTNSSVVNRDGNQQARTGGAQDLSSV
jgi:surface antigen